MTDTNILRRRDDENDQQYIWRVGNAKDNGLIDLNWPDLAKVLNRELYPNDSSKWLHECVYRKEYRAAREYYDNVFCHLAPDEKLRALEEQKRELRKEAQQAADQRRELRKYERLEAREEHLHEIIRQAAKSMPQFAEEHEFLYYSHSLTHHEAVLFLNDWHYGMVTHNVWNDYDMTICESRVNELFTQACLYLQQNNVHTLHLVLLGDMCHGAIHTSARVESEEIVCGQLMKVSELIAKLIEGFRHVVSCVNVYSTYGNHMRTVQNSHDSLHYDNMERIIPWWIAERFRGCKGVEVIEQDRYGEIIHIPVCGCNILAVHGDLDRLRSAGTTLHTLFAKRFGIDADYVVMGDKHHSESIDMLGIECIIAPALCGTDGYAHNKRLYSSPGQIMMLFGKTDAETYGQECTYRMVFR